MHDMHMICMRFMPCHATSVRSTKINRITLLTQRSIDMDASANLVSQNSKSHRTAAASSFERLKSVWSRIRLSEHTLHHLSAYDHTSTNAPETIRTRKLN